MNISLQSFFRIDAILPIYILEYLSCLLPELQNFIRKQQTDITEFDDSLVRKLIQQITVYDDHFTVEFKSGITINIEA
jgi:hypothetical protein